MRRFIIRASDAPPMRDPMSMTGAVLRLLVGAGGIFLLFRWGLRHRDEQAVLVTLVVCAPLVLPLVVPGLLGFIPALWRFSRERHLSRWQGRYYEFEGRQIRIEEIGGRVWIAVSDARAAAGLSAHDPKLNYLADEHCRDLRLTRQVAVCDALLLELLAERRQPEAARFRRWLEKDVLPPLYRRARGGRPVPETLDADDHP